MSTGRKGPREAESNPAVGPLTLPGDSAGQPGEKPPTHPYLPSLFPQPSPDSHPFLQTIRPLTSTGLFSPPSHLPLVTLPNHPPLSPITGDSGQLLTGTPSSVLSAPAPVERLQSRLQRSNIQDWVANLSPEPEGDWDSYNNSPSYNQQEKFWNSREEAQNDGDIAYTSDRYFLSPVPSSSQEPDIQQVELVDTICSELDSDIDLVTCVRKGDLEMSGPGVEDSATQRRADLTSLEGKLHTAKQRHTYLLERLTEEDVDEDSVASGEIAEDLRVIKNEEIWMACSIKEMVDIYRVELGETKVTEWENYLIELPRKVKAHSKKIKDKIRLVAPPRNLSSYEIEMLEIQRKLVNIEIQRQQDSKEQKDQEKKKAKSQVTAKVNDFRNKVRRFEEHIKLIETRDDPDYWETAEDEEIIACMKDLKTWETNLAAIEKVYIEAENLAKLHGEPEDASVTGFDIASVKALLLDLRLDFKDAKDAIVMQDSDRNLFSLNTTKGEVLKYPTFSGDPSQDYVKFKEKMVNRFKRNHVAKQDQLEKLRENLKGQASRLVPESTKNIDTAWDILKDAFGDPVRVLQHRLDTLEAMGDIPPESTDRGDQNLAARVEFMIKLENTVREIIDLGNSDEDLMMLAFNGKTVAAVLNKFPNHQILKLNRVPGRGKQRLTNILAKISGFRSEAQELEKTRSLLAPSKSYKQKDPRKQQQELEDNTRAQVSYNPPRKEPECRVCCHLKEVQKVGPKPNTVFFDNHLSNYVTGCPQFVLMDMTERFQIVADVKLCNRCFRPDVTFTKEHIKECTAKSDKNNAFSCSKCKLHSWVCKYHKADNQAKLDKFKKEYRDKHQLKLVFTANLLPPDQSDNLNTGAPGVPVTVAGAALHPAGDPTSAQSCCSEVSMSAAAKAMKKRIRSNGFKGDIRPVPEGEPMFLFFKAKGNQDGVNTFFDLGCSHAVFQEGVPGRELRGKILKKGPFIMNGVADIKTKANNMWLCTMDMADGSKQFVAGLSVDKVTSDFPEINLETAVDELKADNPANTFLQACRVPNMAGGSTGLLLGIQYSTMHPEMVHQLPSGLAIFKSKLSSQGNKFTCLIGGPHKSFDVYANQTGGAANLLAHFVEGIQKYRAWGPPKLDCAPATLEEELFAKEMNKKEGDLEEFRIVACLDELDDILEGREDLDVNLDDQIQELPAIKQDCHCTNMPFCCYNLSAMISDLDTSPGELGYLKKLLFAQDGGLSVEYRCVKCRDCWPCKNADATEKLSLREEQENQLIQESVKLDFQNKSIICTLPTRGEEREFLTSNKDLATKVLLSVCKRYQGDLKAKELILGSFKKLFDNGYIKLMDQLTPEEKSQFENKEVQYHIPWRPVFADSVTTPCRSTFDASSRTKKRADGSGGRCLNDLIVKGSVDNLNLLRLVLKWQVGQFAMSGDLAQFYNCLKLLSQQWNLQKFLWSKDLDPDGEIFEGVITTLIYGVKSVAGQSECSLEQLADIVEEIDPELAELLRLCRYVDDIGDSKPKAEQCQDLARRADDLFARVGLECKGWSFSGQDPPERVSKDGLTVGIGGMKWTPALDAVQVKIPFLHFGKRRRGKLDEKTPIFNGVFADLDEFIPKNLTRRHVTSKLASVFDLFGKFIPILIGLRLDVREVVLSTSSWDEAMSQNLRNKWIINFWKLEQLRGINFHRPIMPEDAVDTRMRLITATDASLEAIMIGCWGCFKLKDGSYSCKLVIGRGLLAPTESTIPKNELESLTGGSNLSWVVRKALGSWIDESFLVGDSVISLCWVTAENKRLSMFHRNRVIQIRRGTELNHLFHVVSNQNPADIGTRPSKVTMQDVGPDSKWEKGLSWMQGDMEKAVSEGHLKPAKELRLSRELEDEYSRGLLFESQIPEIITRGHAVNQNRVSLLQQRADFSNYILLPTKLSFPATVRVYSMVMAFVSKSRRNRKLVGALLRQAGLNFAVFTTTQPESEAQFRFVEKQTEFEVGDEETRSLVNFFFGQVSLTNKITCQETQVEHVRNIEVSDKFINMAMVYLYRKGSNEVKEFNPKSTIKKHMIEKDGILLSKNRMIAGLDYINTGELNINLGALGIKVHAPVLDRFSPLAYSIAQHVHWELAPHRGMETHNRVSLEHVHILQGMTLYKELSQECIRCNMRRKRYLEVSMGAVKPEQLIIAPPFWACQIDLFGPYRVYVPGFERETRNRKVLDVEVHILAIVCPTTRLVNLQVVEKTDAGGIICGFTRLACEVGMPKFVFCDQDGAIMAALDNAEVDTRDLQHQLHREHQIVFSVCPVG